MRDAARALDDVSDHLGEVLRRADQLLAEWSAFGAQVRVQVEREAGAIGAVVDSAVARAASGGLDHAITDRLRALTGELDRLEQRTRAASRAVAEQRETDRRLLWVVIAGVVLANALLAAILLRKPASAPAPEPVRMEAPAAPQPPVAPPAAPASGDGSAAAASGAAGDGSAATAPAAAGSGAAGAAGSAASPASAKAGSAAGAAGSGSAKTEPANAAGSAASSPARSGGQRPHHK